VFDNKASHQVTRSLRLCGSKLRLRLVLVLDAINAPFFAGFFGARSDGEVS